jgi:hypothetical protein
MLIGHWIVQIGNVPMTTVFTYTLSSGNVIAIYREVTAGEAIITIILMGLLILEIADLVRKHA